jgi:hypothetical protein
VEGKSWSVSRVEGKSPGVLAVWKGLLLLRPREFKTSTQSRHHIPETRNTPQNHHNFITRGVIKELEDENRHCIFGVFWGS